MSPSARLILVCALLLGGCGWDGPTATVRVVPEGAVGGDDVTHGHSGQADTDGSIDANGVGGEERATGASSRRREVSENDGRSSAGSGAVEGRPDITIGRPFPTTVAVVGDSLTLSARDEITSELSGLGLDVLVVDGVESRRMAVGSTGRSSGLDAIKTIHDEFDAGPDLWVIALGTNDVGAQVEEQRFRDDVRAALAGVGAEVPVVWVDIWIRDRRDAVVTANGVIRDELARRTAPSGVVGWFAHGGGDGLVTDDGVHLTNRGQAAFATAIADRVRTIYHR